MARPAGNRLRMPPPQPEARQLARLASLALGLVLLVVLASAAIRLGQSATPPLGAGALLALRAVHRTAASLEVLVVLWLAWQAWRARRERPAFARGTALALAITLALSALGIAAGQTPSPPAALGNVLGGLTLAATFAWLAGSLRPGGTSAPQRLVALGAVLIAVQCLLGARLAIFPGAAGSPALPVHAMLGLALAVALAMLARRAAGRGLALLVPVAGFTALQFDFSASAAFAHAAAAALLVVAAAWARLRLA